MDHVSKPLQRQEVAARISVHLRLRELTIQLEEKVNERTEELLFTNQRLQQEISERKRIDRELLVLNGAINNSNDAVSLINEQLLFVYVNDQACRDLDYSREELLAMGPQDIDPDVSLDMLKEMQNTLSEIRFLKPFETRHRAKDVRIFPVEISSTLLEHDGVKLFISVARKISERKRATQQLDLLNHALDHGRDGAFLFDLQGRFL